MILKNDSVNPVGLCPEMLLAVIACQEVLGRKFVITSINDSMHSRTSLHYAGRAMDVRIRDLDMDPAIAVYAIKDALNHHYDVILESNHIHIEFQPRREN